MQSDNISAQLRNVMDDEYRQLVLNIERGAEVDVREAAGTLALVQRSPEEVTLDCERLTLRREASAELDGLEAEKKKVAKLHAKMTKTKSVTAPASQKAERLSKAYTPGTKRGPTLAELRQAELELRTAKEESDTAFQLWNELHIEVARAEEAALRVLHHTGTGSQEQRLVPENFEFSS